jgi:hypothetical protein
MTAVTAAAASSQQKKHNNNKQQQQLPLYLKYKERFSILFSLSHQSLL